MMVLAPAAKLGIRHGEVFAILVELMSGGTKRFSLGLQSSSVACVSGREIRAMVAWRGVLNLL